jgi:hypothetical protein
LKWLREVSMFCIHICKESTQPHSPFITLFIYLPPPTECA